MSDNSLSLPKVPFFTRVEAWREKEIDAVRERTDARRKADGKEPHHFLIARATFCEIQLTDALEHLERLLRPDCSDFDRKRAGRFLAPILATPGRAIDWNAELSQPAA